VPSTYMKLRLARKNDNASCNPSQPYMIKDF